jgi:hypothetical protein
MSGLEAMLVPTYSDVAGPGAGKVWKLGSFSISLDGITTWEFWVNTSPCVPLYGVQVTEPETRHRIVNVMDEDNRQIVWDGTEASLEEIIARAKQQTWSRIASVGVGAFMRGVEKGKETLKGLDLEALYLGS